MMLRFAVALAVLAVSFANIHDRAFYEEKFFDWMSTHGLKPTTPGQFVHWLNNFADNHDFIETTNAQNLSYTVGHNKFSHMTTDEWRAYVRLGLDRPDPSMKADAVLEAPADLSTLATSIDWTTQGAVTPVKDQGQCGSCWSFSTTGALEGAYFLSQHSLVSFSEQNLVDCDTRTNNNGKDHGCNGGLMDNAFTWVKANNGLCTEAGYPYESGTTKTAGTCRQSSCTKNTAVTPKGYTDVTPNSDSAMMAALNKQPVSVAIEADQKAFQLYTSGVFTAACGTNLDHGVLAVGYGTLNGVDYYKVKNSWGPTWGDKGYILLQRGVSQKGGQCGILMSASYPNL